MILKELLYHGKKNMVKKSFENIQNSLEKEMPMYNHFRYKKIDNNYFASCDDGSFMILDKKRLDQLRNQNIKKEDIQLFHDSFFIISNKNSHKYKESLERRFAYMRYPAPTLHIVIPTLRCNLRCTYCHASAKTDTNHTYDMTEETAKRTVEFIMSTPSKYITIEFQGGEPLLNYPIINLIITYAREINKKLHKELRFDVVTNLTRMKKEMLDFLIAKDIHICTSLDGPKELHKKNRPGRDEKDYEKIIGWIQYINNIYKKEKTGQKVNALVTITKESLEYKKEIIDTYISLGIQKIFLRFLDNLGYSEKNKHISYSSEAFIKFWKESLDYIISLQEKGISIQDRLVDYIYEKITNKDPNYLDLRSPCGAIIGQLAYDYDGSIYTCDEARMIHCDQFMVGDVFNNNLKSILRTNKAQKIIEASINNNYTCNECAYQPYCGVCPVCNYAECKRMHIDILKTTRCKIYKEIFDWTIKNCIITKRYKAIQKVYE
jgi:uncharacterized protein